MKEEFDKIIKAERRKLLQIGEKLVNKVDKRILLEEALRSWERMPQFMKNKMKQKNNFIKEYLEDEYINLAKKYKEKINNEKKWELLKE